MKKSKLTLAFVVLCLTVPVSSREAVAGPTWICAIARATEVDETGMVGTPDLGGLERPTFLRVDSDRKQVTLLAPPSRAGEVTKIDSVHEADGIWVFSGVEEGRAWSMVVSDTGYMTLSVTGDGATWSVFGSAMQED